MCWCWPFGSTSPKRNKSQVREKKKKEGYDSLHGDGVAVVAEVRETRRPKEKTPKKKPRESQPPRELRRTRDTHRLREEIRSPKEHRVREPQRPALNVQVPDLWHRSVDPASSNSSTEMLLNPRPHRSPHHRQRHPKRTSQTTLRGRGAKRDPPSHSKSKKSPKQASTKQSGWSFFSPSPPKTPQRRSHRQYEQVSETSPRSDRSRHHRHHNDYGTIPQQPQYQAQPQPQPYSSQQRHHRSRQHTTTQSHATRNRSRTPNTAARRTPDRRFAVLAATNQALEDLRREAFAQPSPPPRRERLQRYQGVAIPTSSIPFNWDCVSSSQASAAQPSSSRPRRSRR